MNEQRAFTPSPEQIAKWRKKFESRYDLSQLGTIYERYLDLAVREAWGNYVEAREDDLTEQATEIAALKAQLQIAHDLLRNYQEQKATTEILKN